MLQRHTRSIKALGIRHKKTSVTNTNTLHWTKIRQDSLVCREITIFGKKKVGQDKEEHSINNNRTFINPRRRPQNSEFIAVQINSSTCSIARIDYLHCHRKAEKANKKYVKSSILDYILNLINDLTVRWRT